MNNKLQYISLLRVLATLFVVLFHSYALYFYNIGFDYDFPYIRVYKWFFLVEERIQMPLFAFISGFLFQMQVSRYLNLGNLIKLKAIRLLLPYVVFGVLFYFTYPASISRTIIPYENIGHLWFLLMLFWLFPIQYLLRKLDSRFQFAIALLMHLMYVKMPHFLCVSSVCWLFVFFNMAYNWQYFTKCIDFKFKIPITLLLSFFVILIYEYPHNTFWWNLVQKIVYFSCTCYWLSLIITTFQRFTYKNKLLDNLDRTSFGIYIFHNYIMLQVLNASQFVRQFVVDHYVVYPILMFLFLVLASWLVSSLIIKTKHINKLI